MTPPQGTEIRKSASYRLLRRDRTLKDLSTLWSVEPHACMHRRCHEPWDIHRTLETTSSGEKLAIVMSFQRHPKKMIGTCGKVQSKTLPYGARQRSESENQRVTKATWKSTCQIEASDDQTSTEHTPSQDRTGDLQRVKLTS